MALTQTWLDLTRAAGPCNVFVSAGYPQTLRMDLLTYKQVQTKQYHVNLYVNSGIIKYNIMKNSENCVKLIKFNINY